jgi:hypothetical protein
MPSFLQSFKFPPLLPPTGNPVSGSARRLKDALFAAPQSYIDTIVDGMWPNPLQPVTPMAPPGAGVISWPIQWGQNVNYTPRNDAEYSAASLRQLSKYIVSRVCIENNKDILCRMPWRIQLRALPGETAKDRAKRSKGDSTLIKLSRFFARPNWDHNWSEFLRPVLDDMLVIDAASIFVGRQKKTGEIAELQWIEGASITRLVDEHGWTPRPPSPAYQQLWEGYPRVDLTTEQLVYKPRNIAPRGTYASYIYGFSPTEEIAKEIEIGIARLQFILDFYSKGSIPGGILFAPVGTPPDKIKEAQGFLDSDLAGNLARRRQLQILQGFQDSGKPEQLHFPQEPSLSDAFDELHIRKICFAFGTSPTRLMRAMNRASASSVQESAEEEGTLPWLDWLKGTMDYIIQILMGYGEYEFAFDPFMELDKLKQAMADSEDIKIGLYSRNEKRQERGDDPVDDPDADELMVSTAQGLVPLSYRPPKTTGAGSKSSPVPRGGSQPKATQQVNATSSLKVEKTNGHTRWDGCAKHRESYPRINCSDCIRAEMDYQARIHSSYFETVL